MSTPRWRCPPPRLGVARRPDPAHRPVRGDLHAGRAGARPRRVAGRARVVRREPVTGGGHAAGGPDGAPDRVPGLRPDGGAGRPAGRAAPGAGPARGHRGAGPSSGVAPGARSGRPADPGRRGTTRRAAPALARAGGDLAAPGRWTADRRGLRRLRRAPRRGRGVRGTPLREPVRCRAGAAATRHAADGQSQRRRRTRALDACRPPRSPTTRPASGSWSGWSAPGWSPPTSSRTSWRTRRSPGRGPGCGPGSTRAWRSSSSPATSRRRRRAGTPSAGPTASSTGAPGCRAPPSGWPATTRTRRRWSASSWPRRRPAPTTRASRPSDRSGTNAGRTVGCASCSPASSHCSSSPPGSARSRSTAAGRLPVIATWPSRRQGPPRTRPSWVARSRSARPTAAWPPCWPSQAFRARPDHLSQSALLASFTASPGFLGYRYLEGDDRPQRRRDPEHPASRRGRDLQSPRSPQHHHRDPDPPLRRSVASSAGLLRPAGQQGRATGWRSCSSRRATPTGAAPRVARATATGGAAPRSWSTTSRPANGCSVRWSCPSGRGRRHQRLRGPGGGHRRVDGDLATYDVATGRRLGRLPGLPRPVGVEERRDTAAVAVRRSGKRLPRLDGRAHPPGRPAHARGPPDPPGAAAVLPRRSRALTGDDVLVAAGNEGLVAVDLVSGRRRWTRGSARRAVPGAVSVLHGRGQWSAGSTAATTSARSRSATWPPVNGPASGLDPQLGSVGDLVVAEFEGTELVAFAAGEVAYSRWRLDGSGLVARLRFDDARRPSATTRPGPTSWWRAGSGLGTRPRRAWRRVRRRRGRHRRPGGGSPGPRTGSRGSTTGLLAFGGGAVADCSTSRPNTSSTSRPWGRDGERVPRPSGRECLGDRPGGDRTVVRELDLGIAVRPRTRSSRSPERCTA